MLLEAVASAPSRIRNLLALGARREHAIKTGLSRKGYWHLSKAVATQTGRTNEWLTKQGLLPIRDLWRNAHGYA